MDTDGENSVLIHSIADPQPVVGLAIDTSMNLLYWSIGGRVEYRNLSQSVSTVSTVNVGGSSPQGLSAANGTLYWASNGAMGAIYSTSLPTGQPSMLNSWSDIQPVDVSTSTPNSKPWRALALSRMLCDGLQVVLRCGLESLAQRYANCLGHHKPGHCPLGRPINSYCYLVISRSICGGLCQ